MKFFGQYNYNILLNLSFFAFLISCTCCGKVEDVIRKCLKDDCKISLKEFQEIMDESSDKDSLALIKCINDVAKKMKGNACAVPVKIVSRDSSGTDKPNKLTYDFFYENSGSMHGYICPDSKIAYAVQDMMIKAEDGGKNVVNMYYINDTIYPIDKSTPFSDFIGKKTKDKKYAAKSSPIDNIIRQAIERALLSKDKISFLISDYEYAANKDNVERTLKEVERNMSKLNEQGYASLISKFETEFNKGKKPIYIWAFGAAEQLIEASSKLDLANQRGYKSHVILLGTYPHTIPFYTILNSTEKHGRFSPSERGSDVIKEIEKIAPSHDNKFSFGLVADFSKIPLCQEDICNIANYSITGATSSFIVESVTPISKAIIDHNDQNKIKNATHLIKVSLVDKIPTGRQKVEINLNKFLPEWAQNDVTSDIKALLDAATSAYNYSDKRNTYISLTLNINN